MAPTVATLEQVLQELRARASDARAVGVAFVGVVGSLARGDATPRSDVDVVFDVVGELDYWKLGALAMDIQDTLGRPIDLVDREMMKPDVWAWMARDLAPL
jgi:uncharacterized protein